MSWEQRNADFCKAQTDAQMAYIEAEREVGRLETENAKLRELVSSYASMSEYLLARQPMLLPYKANELQELDEKRHELGIEVDVD